MIIPILQQVRLRLKLRDCPRPPSGQTAKPGFLPRPLLQSRPQALPTHGALLTTRWSRSWLDCPSANERELEDNCWKLLHSGPSGTDSLSSVLDTGKQGDFSGSFKPTHMCQEATEFQVLPL